MQEIKLKLDDSVNTLALQTATLIDRLTAAELQKVNEYFGDNKLKKVRSNAAGVKHLLMLVGFCYVEAIKSARDERVKKSQPLPGQKTLLPEVEVEPQRHEDTKGR